MPATFVEKVKRALEHLYDLNYLQEHPLTRPTATDHAQIGGQAQRRALAAAIEALNPGGGVAFRAPQARPYNMTRMHYVQGMTVQEAARELGVSERQAYRDLRQGEKSVAAVLWTQRDAAPLPPSSANPAVNRSTARTAARTAARALSSMEEEMARLKPHPHPTDVRRLLRRAQALVAPLAQQRDVALTIRAPAEPVIISSDPVIARQVLVGLLSRTVQQAEPASELHITLRAHTGHATLHLRYDLDLRHREAPARDIIIAQLIDRLGWDLRREERSAGAHAVTLHIAAQGPTVLVVDDNEGLVHLLSRYLTDHACRVVAATSSQEGLHLAQTLEPDAIVLDIMMPEMDGWELLQRLRAHPKTQEIPVVICSVINDPDLARSLGASFFLPKPVSRRAVLDVLQQLGVA
jgi:CheY-like chemotaxis protein